MDDVVHNREGCGRGGVVVGHHHKLEEARAVLLYDHIVNAGSWAWVKGVTVFVLEEPDH